MNNNSGSLTCAMGCWGGAALAGVLAAALLMVLGDWTFLQGVFAGVVIFLVAGALIRWLICSPLPGPHSATSRPAANPAAAPEKKAAPVEKAAPSAAPSAAPAAAATASAAPPGPAVKASKAPAGQAELATRKGQSSYPDAAAPAAAPAQAGKRPEALKQARGGKADDLKKIKGIGPKLEQLCHKLGFFHFDQIAGWTAEEIAWVDDNLEGFKGRVTRDEWVSQAKLLAKGGETAFSRKVDKGDVY